MLSTPILNPPQCAILGMHAIRNEPLLKTVRSLSGRLCIWPFHTITAWLMAAKRYSFLVTIKECLEAPAHLLLNI